MLQEFAHFHLHSEYSLRDGIVQIDALVNAVKAKAMQAVALTDRMNLFAAVKFYLAALSVGIKPILGCEIILRETPEAPEASCIFLCQNKTGYHHLTQIISRAYTENQDERGPWVKYEWLKNYSEGLIVLSGGVSGDIGQAILNEHMDVAHEKILFWKNLFPERFYLELQRLDKPQEEIYLHEAVILAEKFDLPVIATNNIRFLEMDDFYAHEARVCIHEGTLLDDKQRSKQYTSKQYLRSPEEMRQSFKDYPEAIENAVELVKRCNLHLSLGKTYLPNFPVPSNITVDEYLTQMALLGLKERLNVKQENAIDQKEYEERLKWELGIIHRMGFAGYFLIVADFIQWAKNNQIPVGPGRGSGAGSLVAYALKITDLDPLFHELLFERFLNPERVSMPDFDIDFCVEGRDRVIEYVVHKYGKENVAQIITYGTMAAKAVVRDVGRVLGHPYGFVDSIAKLIPFELGMTLNKALEQEEELKKRYDEDEDVKALLDLGLKLEGTVRNVGKHAGGVVIAPSALTDFTAIYCEPGSIHEQEGNYQVTQFDKGDVEAVGLVKFDFLGLKTLTIIDRAVKTINQGRINEPLLDITLIPIDDIKTFELLKTSQTTALFQLESRGMRDLVRRLQLDCFDDIMALVALYRPGPLQSGMVDDFIDRKQGKTAVVYPHPDLENVLKPTYGVILYQEQVMQIAQLLAGYTLGGADILRSAMGKKKVEEMAKQRKIFVDGASARGVDSELATSIFDLMEKFAGYGFNKSHSAAYALVSYQTAWLKAHYPAEFMAAVMSADMDNTDKIKDFVEECHLMNLVIKKPSLNSSDYYFTVNNKKEILYGLGAIKGIGEAAIELILKERKNGIFNSLFNLCQRVDLRKVSRKVIEALIGSGACDEWNINRGVLSGNVEKAIKSAEQMDKKQGQKDIFHLLENVTNENETYDFLEPWNKKNELKIEKEKLGFYFSGHPFESYHEELSLFVTDNLRDLAPQKTKVTVAGLVVDVRKILTKKGKKMAIVTMDDNYGKLEIAVFSELLETVNLHLNKDEILIIQGEASLDDYSNNLRMRADNIMTVPEARQVFGKYLLLIIQSDVISENGINILQESMKKYSTGEMRVKMKYQTDNASIEVNAGNEYYICPEDELIETINHITGISAKIVYASSV